MEDKDKRIIVVCGATATGKSGLAVAVAKNIDGEIISADSMQIYKGLDVATAKVTAEEAEGIVHHMIDIAEPYESFSVADYVRLARPMIDDIIRRGKKVIICGGTGLYINALCDGREFIEGVESPDLLCELNNIDTDNLYAQLKEIDPVSAMKIHPNNRKRLIRAIYVSRLIGKPFSVVGEEAVPTVAPYNRLVLYCNYPNRAELYDAINKRVDIMHGRGLLNEAEYVYKNRERFQTAAAAIGYKELFDYIEGKSDLDKCIADLKQATRHYAKRQMSWFNRYSDAISVEAYRNGITDGIVQMAKEFFS